MNSATNVRCKMQPQQIAIDFFMRVINIGCTHPGTLLYWLHINMWTEQ